MIYNNLLESLYEYDFLKSLLLTIMIESMTLIMMVKYYFKYHTSWNKLLFAGIFPSFATLPYVWFILPIFFLNNPVTYIWVAEISVTLIEALILFFILSLSWKKAILISVFANFLSYGIGKLI